MSTHWPLADGTDVEILNIIDDHSRLLVASAAFAPTRANDVVATFRQAANQHGMPASMLTDNGAIFTAKGPPRPLRHGDRAGRPRCGLQALEALPPSNVRQGRAVPPDAGRSTWPASAEQPP